MPRLTRVQLVLLELALAALLGGAYFRGYWLYAGFAVAALFVALAVVPVQRRWIYQLGVAWLGLVRRRRQGARLRGGPALAGVLGGYSVETVPGGRSGESVGVVRSGTTWCLPLALGLDQVFNDDAAVPVAALLDLMQIEDVPLSSVRLFTMSAPAQSDAHAPTGPAALSQLAARYCLLTLDTRRAADAIAARGGSQAAVEQILRRCAVHAEQTLAAAGLPTRRLSAAVVESLFASWMGPAAPTSGRRAGHAVESWNHVRVAGTWSTVFAVTGSGDDVVERVARLASVAPTPLVATSLLVRRAKEPGQLESAMLLRLSAPETYAHAETTTSLMLLAKALDLVMQRLGGEQGLLLRATSPIGLGEPV